MPAALLAFANDWVDDKRHLRSLLDEAKAISAALEPLIEAGLDVPAPIHNATIDDVIGAFRARGEAVRIFHFGGHASGAALLLEDHAGEPAEVHAGGLAGYLGQQHGLVLVFLNGCTTAPQVQRLRAAGVKAVVATTQDIQDPAAAAFAAAFYAELAARPLRDAFDTAASQLKTRWGDDPRAVMRDIAGHHEPRASTFPWIVDCDPAFEGWSLRTELAKRTNRPWRRRALFAATAVVLPLAMWVGLSAEARRTVCRVPGVRELCSAAGVGQVPTAVEQALWDAAVAQSTGDGLRAYLQRYPDGAYALEARARLDGCTRRQVEAPGPERDLPHRYAVALGRRFASEREARRDALNRGKDDAREHCATLTSSFHVVDASIVDRAWKCIAYDGESACGFDGEVICRARERLRADEETCRADRK